VSPSLDQTTIVRRLGELGAATLAGRLLELPGTVQSWLAYTPATFPHFTRHTSDHSLQIVVQLGKLLFIGDDPSQPAVAMSEMEYYLLVVAAYLHDAGMVASDAEKQDILGSSEWQDWIDDGAPGNHRWRNIVDIRSSPDIPDEAVRNFIADREVRFLLADFVRRSHHLRSAGLLAEDTDLVASFTLSDPGVSRVLAKICAGHGLRPADLEDTEQYPHRADVHGAQVNVRFLAHLLRIGDLLDMGCERACPTLLGPASPLPPGSMAHWTQYQRIVHRLTAPDQIEIVAECENQEEHRLLQDWCQWIVDEVQAAGATMARSARHGGWRPPIATLGGESPTIKIGPSPTATYVPTEWTYQFDFVAVLERLMHDVYSSPLAWVRELLQNGLDATRCRLAISEMSAIASNPLDATEAVRAQYPVRIVIDSVEFENPLSGEVETRGRVAIHDRGIGMNRRIIEDYFLQIGRSYYRTPEFRRTFGFVPTSKFGIGFLAVFGVSDHIVVDTLDVQPGGEPLRLTLTGPRNYFLTERGHRDEPGTSIAVTLRDAIEPDAIVQQLREWCRMVEFPVVVEWDGHTTEILAENADDFGYDEPVLGEPNRRFALRATSFDRGAVRGNLLVFSVTDERGEDWTRASWAAFRYPEMHPLGVAPVLPEPLICVNGLAVSNPYVPNRGAVARIDIRSDWEGSVDREQRWVGPYRRPVLPAELREEWELLVDAHLSSAERASGDTGWEYRQRLVPVVEGLEAYWDQRPDMIPLYVAGRLEVRSVEAVVEMSTIEVFTAPPETEIASVTGRMGSPAVEAAAALQQSMQSEFPMMTRSDIASLSIRHRAAIFQGRTPVSASFDDQFWRVVWRESQSVARQRLWATARGGMHPVPLNGVGPSLVGMQMHRTRDATYDDLLLNSGHPLVQWIEATWDLSESQGAEEVQVALRRLVALLDDVIRYPSLRVPEIQRYLARWRESGFATTEPPTVAWGSTILGATGEVAT
jgi:molecular chaperone HtpG